jgi:hypothetical protein
MKNSTHRQPHYFLAIAAVLAISSCGTDDDSADNTAPGTSAPVTSTSIPATTSTEKTDGTTSVPTTEPEPNTTTSTAATSTTPTTAPPSTSSTAAPTTTSLPVGPASVVAQIDSCPDLQFSTLVGGWNPVVENVQGGGSGLPGHHIGGPDSYMNLFAGGSVFGPTTGQAIEVDSYQALRGPIEDGLGVRIDIGEPDCDLFDLTFYGNSESEVTMILDGLMIEA